MRWGKWTERPTEVDNAEGRTDVRPQMGLTQLGDEYQEVAEEAKEVRRERGICWDKLIKQGIEKTHEE